MNEIQTAIGLLLLLLASIPVALIVVIATRQPRDMIDFTGWTPPDENTETPAETMMWR